MQWQATETAVSAMKCDSCFQRGEAKASRTLWYVSVEQDQTADLIKYILIVSIPIHYERTELLESTYTKCTANSVHKLQYSYVLFEWVFSH